MDIPQEVYDAYYDAVDAFTDTNFGVNCQLQYPEKRVDCPNCVFDPMARKSSGKYQSGGPISFTTGLCPYCNGVGYSSSVDTDTIKLRVYFDKKSFAKISVAINIKDGQVMTIGKIIDLPKVRRCSFIVIATGTSNYVNYKYELAGEPILHGITKSRYFIAVWNRI